MPFGYLGRADVAFAVVHLCRSRRSFVRPEESRESADRRRRFRPTLGSWRAEPGRTDRHGLFGLPASRNRRSGGGERGAVKDDDAAADSTVSPGRPITLFT